MKTQEYFKISKTNKQKYRTTDTLTNFRDTSVLYDDKDLP